MINRTITVSPRSLPRSFPQLETLNNSSFMLNRDNKTILEINIRNSYLG